MQTIQILLLTLSNVVLGGITGAIINLINCIRNILYYKEKLGTASKILLIASGTVLSLLFNNLGVLGLLPVISTILYTLLMNTQDVIKFKKLIVFTMITWLIYDLVIKSYISAIFDFMSIITGLISIFKIKKQKIEEQDY